MFKLIFKSIAAFTISYLVLSINIEKRPIFYWLSHHTSDLTQRAIDLGHDTFKKGINAATGIGKKMLKGEPPRSSSIYLKKEDSPKVFTPYFDQGKRSKKEPTHELTEKEKKALESLF